MSSSSLSSSSYEYCQYPECTGDICANFYAWKLNNVKNYLIGDNKIYIVANYIGALQQIELYSDSNYYHLIGIGQGSSAGIINIVARNGSQIYGEVLWSGTADYYSVGTLYCISFSTSSSTSSESLSSKSNSSKSSQSLSTSSSDCCEYLYGTGLAFQRFSLWNIIGVNTRNSDKCKLYVGLDNDSGNQRVWIYKNSAMSELVAIGQSNIANIIIYGVNGSGLSGTVQWDLVPIVYPSIINLTCTPPSTSSSSSISSRGTSSSNSSSISSVEFSSSSSSDSSTSFSSFSSMSKSSSSSSSSIDSSSSSSKDSSSSSSSSSKDSSSSSTSLIVWNAVKPLYLAHSAISNGLIQNRLAQTILIEKTNIKIKTVYCYLYKEIESDLTFDINVEVYFCDDDGKPLTLLSSKTIQVENIIGNEWNAFDINVPSTQITNGMISIVMWQNGGDENNYCLWGYTDKKSEQTKAFISNDNVNWTHVENTLFGLKITEDFSELFDLTNKRAKTEPAQDFIFPRDLSYLGNNFNVVYNSTNSVSNSVSIAYPKIYMSLIVDSSGSMGWNDRFNNRAYFANSVVNHLNSYYPNDFLLDVVTFGAVQVDPSGFSQNNKYMKINLDARSPTRGIYIFTADSSASVSSGAIYVNNGMEYTVIENVVNDVTIVCNGKGAPFITGTLIKQSGVGDENIVFGTYRTINIDNSNFIAYGFKNLETGHIYNVGDILIDDVSIGGITSPNWQTFHTLTETPSISLGNNGPSDSESLDIVATNSLVARSQFSTKKYAYSGIINEIYKGNTSISVSDVSYFVLGQKIDLVCGDRASYAHEIINISNNAIVVSVGASFNINSQSQDNGMVQESSFYNLFKTSGTTFMLSVRDEKVTRAITFFIQSVDGFYLEWDFKPHKQWTYYDFNWLGETAVFPVELKDKNGDNLEDGTEIVFEVNSRTELLSKSIISQNIIEKANVGETKIYVSSLDGFKREMEINVVDSSHVQVATIFETGVDSDLRSWIKIYQPLQFVFDPINGAKIIIPETNEPILLEENKVSTALSLVDITPIWAGETLPPEKLKKYDPPQIPPSTNYNDLNYAKDYIRNGVHDLPSIKGSSVLRILPITEDALKTDAEKEKSAEKMLFITPSLTGLESVEQNIFDANAINIDTGIVSGEDYTIESPVFLNDGISKSSMASTATTFEERRFENMTFPWSEDGAISETIYTKSYGVFPSIVKRDKDMVMIAKQYFPSFQTFFTPRYYISSKGDGQTVKYWRPQICQNAPFTESCCPSPGLSGYEKIDAWGVYAGSGNSFKINYTVSDKFSLLKNGQLKIKIYSNNVRDIEPAIVSAKELSTVKMNTKLKDKVLVSDAGETTIVPQYSLIDEWRNIASNNPIGAVVENPPVITDGSNEDGIDSVSSDVGKGNEVMHRPGSIMWAMQQMKDIYGTTTTTTTLISASTQEYLDEQKAQQILTKSNEKEIEPTHDLFYTNPYEWVLAKHLPFYETTLNIVNGKASLEIPQTDKICMLFVEAIISYSNGFETIRGDIVCIANPIQVSPNDKLTLGTVDSSTTYELSHKVTWMENPIEDGVSAELLSTTNMTPTISITDGGIIKGNFIGPHSILYGPNNIEATCQQIQQFEKIKIKVVNSSGFIYECERLIAWQSVSVKSKKTSNIIFVAKAQASQIKFSTGEMDTSSPAIKIDLNDAFNPEIIGFADKYQYWLGEENIERLMGFGQPDGQKPILKVAPVAKNVTVSVLPSVQTFSDEKAASFYCSMNVNIGNPKVRDLTGILESPWNHEVNISTSIRNNSVKNQVMVAGLPPIVDEKGKVKFNYPLLQFKEPLSVDVSLEAFNGLFYRDGIFSPNIVADIKWEGRHLKNVFIFNLGLPNESVISYPMPIVEFRAGTMTKENRTGIEIANPIDTRCKVGDCLTMTSNVNAQLTNYNVRVGLLRTDIYTDDGLNSHTHSCVVDDNGNGYTEETIILSGYEVSHVHTIVNFESDVYDDSHSHLLRSVAITQLLPTTVDDIDIAINAYCPYDPTNAEVFASEATSRNKYYPYPDGCNRLMWSTLFLKGGIPTVPKLKMELMLGSNLTTGSSYVIFDKSNLESDEPVHTFYTAESPDVTAMGIDIRARAYYSSYEIEVAPGIFETIAERDVDDGTRVSFVINVYKSMDEQSASNFSDTNKTTIVAHDVVRKYMTIVVAATVKAEDQIVSISVKFNVSSLLQWLPSVKALLAESTRNTSLLSNAISKINSIGASQIYDAVHLSANRIADFNVNNVAGRTYEKMIVMLTDGDENNSQYSIGQAMKSVYSINGIKTTPIYAVKLGSGYNGDEIPLLKLTQETSLNTNNSNIFYMRNLSNSDVIEVMERFFLSNSCFSNQGSYTVRLQTENLSMPFTAQLFNQTLPANTSLYYRMRTSVDGLNWSTWSEWLDSTVSHEESLALNKLSKYFEYEIKFYGNEIFESPKISEGLSWEYLKPKETTVFFNPSSINVNDKQYLSSILFTHNGTIPALSKVNYGITQSNSTDPQDYYQGGRLLSPNKQEILLSRYNEPLITNNYKTYLASNGRWVKTAKVSVYKYNSAMANGELVDQSLYIANSLNGAISFITQQSASDKFLICIELDPIFRFICKIINYSKESAIIDSIGLTYNIMQRIPTDTNGNIINKLISDRINI